MRCNIIIIAILLNKKTKTTPILLRPICDIKIPWRLPPIWLNKELKICFYIHMLY